MTSPSAAPRSIHERALADIRFIRSAVEGAGAFTAVPGLGGVSMGVVALFATAVAATGAPTPSRWLAVWLTAAVVATTVGLVAMIRKARRAGVSLVSPPARRFALAFIPAIVAGIALTAALVSRDAFDLLPPLWLLLYGVAVAAGGALSVRVVPVMGAALIALGLVAFFVPFSIANLLLGFGFGVLQIVTGTIIIRRFGG